MKNLVTYLNEAKEISQDQLDKIGQKIAQQTYFKGQKPEIKSYIKDTGIMEIVIQGNGKIGGIKKFLSLSFTIGTNHKIKDINQTPSKSPIGEEKKFLNELLSKLI